MLQPCVKGWRAFPYPEGRHPGRMNLAATGIVTVLSHSMRMFLCVEMTIP